MGGMFLRVTSTGFVVMKSAEAARRVLASGELHKVKKNRKGVTFSQFRHNSNYDAMTPTEAPATLVSQTSSSDEVCPQPQSMSAPTIATLTAIVATVLAVFLYIDNSSDNIDNSLWSSAATEAWYVFGVTALFAKYQSIFGDVARAFFPVRFSKRTDA